MPSKRKGLSHDALATAIRNQIVAGKYPAGSRLPTRVVFEEQFTTSSVTVQRALDLLVEQGFAEVPGRRSGTFVSAQPPHLNRYLLVGPHDPGGLGWSRYWMAMSKALATLARQRGVRAEILAVHASADDDNYQLMMKSIKENTLAGVILSGDVKLPRAFLEKPPAFPIVQLSRDILGGKCPSVILDWEGLVERALKHLAAQGRRKVAVIYPPSHQRHMVKLADLAAANGITLRPYWTHVMDPSVSAWVANTVHLMMNPRQEERPDGLVVLDDNLVEAVSRGLVDAGVRLPGELELVCHCNYPWPPNTALPVTWLGFDVREILNACFDTVDALRRKQRVAGETRIPSRFEGEVAGA